MAMAEGALAGVQGCTAPPFFEMDCNAPPNFENFINIIPQMGVQNQSSNKAMHPCFEIPNAPPAPDLKLGQSPLPSQRVLLLIAGIIHGRPVLDVSLTPLPPRSYLMQCGTWP